MHTPIAKHKGIETVLRYAMQTAYVIEGIELVETIKSSCERCKILAKRIRDISMDSERAP